jgi:predicted HD superfamily hydrolase involved in NAD metabolism
MGADKEKVRIAAILHDYCKYWSPEELISWIKRFDLPADLLDYHPELWHAPVGAEVAREEFGIEDEEILNGIRYHTTGRPGMSLVEKIIFLADYIEPGRQFPGVDLVRNYAKIDIDKAILQALDNTICYLIERKQSIYPLTLLTRNSFLELVKKSKEESH